MTGIDDRLARVLKDAVPDPPRDLDPAALRAVSVRRVRRKRVLRPALAAVAVAAGVIGIAVAEHQAAIHHRPSPTGPAGSSRPAGYADSEYGMALWQSAPVVGGIALPRATCTPRQISATAVTRRTAGGVLGVIQFTGAVISDVNGSDERCALPIAQGPSALTGADGRRLTVPLSGGDRISQPSNPRPDIALTTGDAIWGFAWFGSYCGVPARAIEVPVDLAGKPALRVPLHGPQPACNPAAGASRLIDGIAGASSDPVQPSRPDYSTLRLSGRIRPGTTTTQVARIDLTLRTIGTAPVILDPCPSYGGQVYASSRPGLFEDYISPGYLPCTDQTVRVRPGHPLHWTIPAIYLPPTPGNKPRPGAAIIVEIGVSGVPPLHLETRAGP